MKMQDAFNMINKFNNKPKGFMVSFLWIADGFLKSDHFPEPHNGEKLIESEQKAWELANAFAPSTKGKTCDIYVVDEEFRPVTNYKDRRIKNR